MQSLRIVAVQLRASILLALQYRMDFLVDGLLELVGACTTIVPLLVVFSNGRSTVAGVSWHDALLVAGIFTVVLSLVEGALMPSLIAVIEHVRTGTLDFVLLLPADAQLLVSTSRFQPFRFVNCLTGLGIVGFALSLSAELPSATDFAVAGVVFACGVVVLYSLLLLAVTASFFVVRVDNLAFLATSVLDAGRWPVRMFRSSLRWFFTFVFPLAVMTSYPADALRGRLDGPSIVEALCLASAFAVGSRLFFRFALRRYSSASS